MQTPPKKRQFSMHPPRACPKSLPNPKRSLSGVPGPSPEAPERSPRAPRAPLERPRDTSGAPPEVARSAQRMQQGTGDLKTSPWDLKKLAPEAFGTSFWSPRGLFFDMFLYVRWPQLADAAPNRTSQFPGGGGESPQASSIYPPPPGRRVQTSKQISSDSAEVCDLRSNTRQPASALLTDFGSTLGHS